MVKFGARLRKICNEGLGLAIHKAYNRLLVEELHEALRRSSYGGATRDSRSVLVVVAGNDDDGTHHHHHFWRYHHYCYYCLPNAEGQDAEVIIRLLCLLYRQ